MHPNPNNSRIEKLAASGKHLSYVLVGPRVLEGGESETLMETSGGGSNLGGLSQTNDRSKVIRMTDENKSDGALAEPLTDEKSQSNTESNTESNTDEKLAISAVSLGVCGCLGIWFIGIRRYYCSKHRNCRMRGIAMWGFAPVVLPIFIFILVALSSREIISWTNPMAVPMVFGLLEFVAFLALCARFFPKVRKPILKALKCLGSLVCSFISDDGSDGPCGDQDCCDNEDDDDGDCCGDLQTSFDEAKDNDKKAENENTKQNQPNTEIYDKANILLRQHLSSGNGAPSAVNGKPAEGPFNFNTHPEENAENQPQEFRNMELDHVQKIASSVGIRYDNGNSRSNP